MSSRSRLARLLQVASLAQCALAAAWLVWRWDTSLHQAVLGAMLVMGAVPILFMVQFVLLAWVARHDDVPRPSAGQLLKAWWGEVRLLYPVFYWRLPFRWNAVPDTPGAARRRGVVLVHGFLCNRGFWLPWMRQLQASGIPFAAVNLEPVIGSIDDYAAIIEAGVQQLVRATGQPPLLVCHSMGGLAARAWLGLPQRSPVAGVVTIGSPHHGTWLARFGHGANGRQMRQGSRWLGALADCSAVGCPPMTCWYSNCDNIVFPPTTATLAGADNRLVRGAAHVELAFHPEVMHGTIAMLGELASERM